MSFPLPPKVDNINFLGVYLDDKFSWKKQIEQVKSKVSKGIGIIYRKKSKLDENSIWMIYSARILPNLPCYCAEVWGNTYPFRLNKLSVLQNKT